MLIGQLAPSQALVSSLNASIVITLPFVTHSNSTLVPLVLQIAVAVVSVSLASCAPAACPANQCPFPLRGKSPCSQSFCNPASRGFIPRCPTNVTAETIFSRSALPSTSKPSTSFYHINPGQHTDSPPPADSEKTRHAYSLNLALSNSLTTIKIKSIYAGRRLWSTRPAQAGSQS